MNVIIIEDEAIAAAELVKMISKLDGSITVLGVLGSVAASIRWFQANPSPDLIFSDIYLSDGTSFDVFSELKEHAPIIFCTAYDQHALQAFNNNGIDYLLKPVSEANLRKCLAKINRLHDGINIHRSTNIMLAKAITEILPQYRKSLIAYEREKIIAIDLKDTCFLVSENNKCMVFTNTASFTLEATLDQIMPTLDPGLFFRANRQYIIQRLAVKSIEVLPLRKLSVTVKGGRETIVISREKKREFLRWVEGFQV